MTWKRFFCWVRYGHDFVRVRKLVLVEYNLQHICDTCSRCGFSYENYDEDQDTLDMTFRFWFEDDR